MPNNLEVLLQTQSINSLLQNNDDLLLHPEWSEYCDYNDCGDYSK